MQANGIGILYPEGFGTIPKTKIVKGGDRLQLTFQNLTALKAAQTGQIQNAYIDKIKTLPSTDADNALIIGTAMHIGIEKGIEEGIKAYYDSFPIITDEHINEVLSWNIWIPKVQEILPEGEYEASNNEFDFVGFIDLISRK